MSTSVNPEGILRCTPPPPWALRDWYQNVPQDGNFYNLNVSKKITLAKFGCLRIFVQPRDENMSISGMGGWGRLTLHRNLI